MFYDMKKLKTVEEARIVMGRARRFTRPICGTMQPWGMGCNAFSPRCRMR